MATWNGVADCPKCGSKGTLMVSGQPGTLEIDGCWVCGYGRDPTERQISFTPLKHLRVSRTSPPEQPLVPE